MKRVWHFTNLYTGVFLNWAFTIYLPTEEDYFSNQYSINIIVFGYLINISTWKE